MLFWLFYLFESYFYDKNLKRAIPKYNRIKCIPVYKTITYEYGTLDLLH